MFLLLKKIVHSKKSKLVNHNDVTTMLFFKLCVYFKLSRTHFIDYYSCVKSRIC